MMLRKLLIILLSITFIATFEKSADAFPGGLLPNTDKATDDDETTYELIDYCKNCYREWVLPRPARITKVMLNSTKKDQNTIFQLLDINNNVLWSEETAKGIWEKNVDVPNVQKVRVVQASRGFEAIIYEVDVFGEYVLPTPYYLKATPDTRSAEITWLYPDDVDGLDHFDIYADGEKKTQAPASARSYRVNGLKPEVKNAIFMVAVLKNGQESAPSETIYVTPYADELISTTKLYATEYPDRIKLDWSETRNATYELVYNDRVLYQGKDRSYVHGGLELDTEYTYQIWIVDKYGRKKLADEITARTREPPDPEKPVVQIVTLEANRIVALWQIGLNPPIWVKLNDQTVRDNVNSNQVVLSGLTPETQYTIVVGYTDKWGRQVSSDPITVTTPPPPDPVSLTLKVQTVTHNSVRITWNKVYDVVEVYRDGEKVAESSSVFYVDYDVKPETQYRYQLRAVDPYGREVYSNEETVTTNSEKEPPPVVKLVIRLQTATHDAARIIWNDDFKSYTVFLNGQQVGTSNSSYYHFDGLTPSTQYVAKVVAVDQYDREVESNELAFTTTAEKGQVFPPGNWTPPPKSDSGNPDLDKPNDYLVDGGNKIGEKAVILTGIIIMILIVMFGSLWLMGVFKKKMTLTKSAKGKENNVLRRPITTNHNQVQKMFQRTNPEPMKHLRRLNYRRRYKR